MIQQSESYLTYHPDGSAASFVGADAVRMYQGAVLASSLKLYGNTGLKHSGVKVGSMFALAKEFTGKAYPKTRAGALVAAADVSKWVQEMKAALPVQESA